MMATDRRTFLKAGCLTLAGSALLRVDTAAGDEPPPQPFPARLGVCTAMGRAQALKDAGADYVEEGVRRLLIPDRPEADFAKLLAQARACPLPIPACNGFLPGSLKSVGADADPEAVLAYADTAFRRAKQVGVEVIVFGSGGSRRIPDGFAQADAQAQFAELLRRMGPLASAQGVTVAIEPLRRQECNFINTVLEGAALAETVDHPAVRLLADIYHMMQNGESAEDLRKVAPLLVHTHVAEKEKRTAPGVAGDDLRPFLSALCAAGYAGRMSIEGRWEIAQLSHAFATIRSQAGPVTP